MTSKSWTSVERPSREPVLPVSSRAVRYGDGVFTTMRLEQGVLLDAASQMRRLAAAARTIGLAPPRSFADGDGLGALVSVLERLGADRRPDGVVRVQWHAGAGPRGYQRGVVEADVVVEFSPAPPERRVAVARLPEERAPLPALPRLKTCSALSAVLCQRAAAELGADEGLRTIDGVLLETATSNLLWLEGGRVYTPAEALPLYAGSVRRRTIETARDAGLEVVEGEFSTERLDGADVLLLTNAVRGVEVVGTLDGRAVGGPDDVAEALIEAVAARRVAAGLRLWWPREDGPGRA